ncbi:MAG TPA: glycosyltransferase family 9 protein [Terriglobales bacterium]|nr:glycosyltransferase family 9 protein [Terriglobales bacterium]
MSSFAVPSTPNIEKLLIVRLSAMGDIIHALPAATALRQAFPQARIGWLVESRWKELLCTPRALGAGGRSLQRPLADRIHTVNTAAWRSSPFSLNTWKEIFNTVREVRGVHYDVAVDFQGAIRSALLAKWSAAPVVYGAAQPRENAASLWYTRQVRVRGEHVVQQNLSLAEAIIGHSISAPKVEFPCDAVMDEEVVRRLAADNIGTFAILNPGAGWGAKQWPAERYGYVARKLAEKGVKPLVNSGPGEEVLALAAEAASGGAAQALTCSLTELIALTRRASLFIGGDTGPMHLAAAMGVPVIGIFGPTNPARNGPFGTPSVILRNAASPTTHRRHPEPDEGLLGISADDVVAAARLLLNDRVGSGALNLFHHGS